MEAQLELGVKSINQEWRVSIRSGEVSIRSEEVSTWQVRMSCDANKPASATTSSKQATLYSHQTCSDFWDLFQNHLRRNSEEEGEVNNAAIFLPKHGEPHESNYKWRWVVVRVIISISAIHGIVTTIIGSGLHWQCASYCQLFTSVACDLLHA